MPGNKPTPDQWSPEAKLAVVIETGALNEAELSEYCRAKGLYVEQVKAWKADSLKGFASSREQELEAKQQRKADKRWYQNGKVLADKRPDAVRTEPANKLSAAELLQRTLLRENCLHTGLVLHSDNGAPMKSQTMRAKVYELGVTTS